MHDPPSLTPSSMWNSDWKKVIVPWSSMYCADWQNDFLSWVWCGLMKTYVLIHFCQFFDTLFDVGIVNIPSPYWELWTFPGFRYREKWLEMISQLLSNVLICGLNRATQPICVWVPYKKPMGMQGHAFSGSSPAMGTLHCFSWCSPQGDHKWNMP